MAAKNRVLKLEKAKTLILISWLTRFQKNVFLIALYINLSFQKNILFELNI